MKNSHLCFAPMRTAQHSYQTYEVDGIKYTSLLLLCVMTWNRILDTLQFALFSVIERVRGKERVVMNGF